MGKGGRTEGRFQPHQVLLDAQSYPSVSRFARNFIMHTDAFGYDIGAVLAQMQRSPHSEGPLGSDDIEVAIACSWKYLDDRHAKRSKTEKEAYAIVHAVVVFGVFKPYLYGR